MTFQIEWFWHLGGLFLWILVLSFLFAKVEIHIEGDAGWAANLPTWRIEEHWLLDIFWGGRAMTGYHAWAFPFVACMFHTPLIVWGGWSLEMEARILGSLIFFWIFEDFLWFVCNPAYGIRKFHPDAAPWHKHWALGVPVDYLIFSVVGFLLLWYSF